jgi:phage I-like protein
VREHQVGRLRRGSQRIGGHAPEWVQIFPYPTYVGEVDGERTEWITDQICQTSCVDFFELRGNDLVIDYEHLSDKDVEAPAAGRIVELKAGGEKGLLARVEWTDKARQQIESGEYFYDSPSFFWSRSDRRIYGLRHLALTNNPASWSRPYITDHAAQDFFGVERITQARGGTPLQLACAVAKTNQGGRERMALTSILERLRAALERSASVSGKELRADVASLMDAIPDTDDALLADGGEQGATLSGGTLAQLIGLPQSETPAASADAAASQSASLAPIALALGIETTDARELAVAIMSLKSNTVPAERVRELEARLAAAEERSGEERIVAEITRQRSAGKQITPAFETELLRVAKSDVGLALSSLAGLQVTSIDLATQADAPAPTVDRLETARQRAAERLAELPGIASGAQKASAAAHEETLAIASERGVTYAQANRIRLESVQVKAAA